MTLPSLEQIGSPLLPEDFANLERRWIDRDLAIAAGIRRVDSATGAWVIGRRDNGTYSGVLIPYRWPGIGGIREYRLRRDQPDFEYRNGVRKEVGKYLGPPGRPSLVYLPPDIGSELLSATDCPLLIVEGEFKTLALWRLAGHQIDRPRFLPLGLAGCWNWKGTIGKAPGPNGERRDVKGMIVDLEKVTWASRRVIIAFDADASQNVSVNAARAQLARELRMRGATVTYVEWPPDQGKGIDDLLANAGPDKVLELIGNADFNAPATRYLWNDAGNGDRLADAYGLDLIYCTERKGFMVWLGTHWGFDELEVERMAERVLRDAFAEAGQIADVAKRNAFLKFLNKSLQGTGISAMVHSAKRKVPQASINVFDADPVLLNFRNTTVDLRAEQVREHRREDRISKCIPFDYYPNAPCPTFMEFLHRIMGSHPDASEMEFELVDKRVEHLQTAFGCAATGKPEKKLHILHGAGNNGKTVLIEVIRDALGDQEYSGEIQVDTLLARSKEALASNSVNADVADLKGRRFVSASEVEQGQRLNLSRVKYLTGGGQIRGRFLGENFFNFRATHKVFIDSNHRPVVLNPNDAIWNRLILVPFDVTIPDDEIDTDLPSKLRKELPGVARWLIEGAARYLKEGLLDLPAVRDATANYKKESDRLAEFIQERCYLKESAQTPVTMMWQAYQKWLEDTGERFPLSKTAFDEGIQQLKCAKGRDSTGKKRVWKGIGLIED